MLSAARSRLALPSSLRAATVTSFKSAPNSSLVRLASTSQSEHIGRQKATVYNNQSTWMRLGLGALIGVGIAVGSQLRAGDAVAADESGLDPSKFKKFKLEKIEDVNYNTKIFRFALPNKKDKLDLPVASYLLTKGPEKDGKPTIRPYTPISESDQVGSFDLLIKHYNGGAMSDHFFKMKVGDELEIKGPMKKWTYNANEKRKIGMIAGGTGVTPMLQIAREVLKNQADQTEIQLVFCNVKEDDILMKKELDEMAAKHKNFKVNYLVEQPSNKAWKGGVGRITPELIKQLMPPPSKDSMVLVCGPDAMIAAISGSKAKDFSQGELVGMLKDSGYDSSNVYKF